MEKWLIETTPDQFLKAEGTMAIHDSGALVFRSNIWDSPTLVMAHGQWISVVRDED